MLNDLALVTLMGDGYGDGDCGTKAQKRRSLRRKTFCTLASVLPCWKLVSSMMGAAAGDCRMCQPCLQAACFLLVRMNIGTRI